MWSLWKSTFLDTHEGLQRQIQACGGVDQFGSTNAATVATNPPRSLTGVTPDILSKMDDHMDKMDSDITNKKAIL